MPRPLSHNISPVLPAKSPRVAMRRALVGVLALVVVAGLLADVPASAGADARLSFANVTAESGATSDPARTWGAAWQDFDVDGDADLFLGRHWHPPILFHQQAGGVFTSFDDEDFRIPKVDRHSCSWGEANSDGRPDLFCARGAGRGHGEGANQLFVSSPDGFEERAVEFGVQDEFGRGRAANWLDYDRDGDLDLFVANHIRAGAPNVMFRNEGGAGFARADVGLARSTASVSSSWSDWDRDGDPDLLVFRYSPRKVLAYENVGGLYRSVTIPKVTDRHWISGAWGDFNGDGWTDLHLVRSNRSMILQNRNGSFKVGHRIRLRNGRMSAWLDAENDGDLDLFVVQGAEGKRPSPDSVNRPDLLIVRAGSRFIRLRRSSWRGPKTGNGDSVAASDYDRDGRTDVFVTNGHYRFFGKQVLLGNRSRAGGWVGVDLLGPLPNPMGIGATVSVAVEGRTRTRTINDGFAFRAQSEVGYAPFGLGGGESADVTVLWPDGTRDCITSPSNVVVTVGYGTLPCS